MTTKTVSVRVGKSISNAVGFLLFSSMLNPAEMYLSKEIKTKANELHKKIKDIGSTISKAITKRSGYGAPKSDSTLDSEIQDAISDTKNPMATIAGLFSPKLDKEVQIQQTIPEIAYNVTPAQIKDESQSFFKGLYKTFVSYAKGGYKALKVAKKNFEDRKPEQYGFEIDIYTSHRIKIIRGPKDIFGYIKEKLALYEFLNPYPAFWY